MVADSMIGRRFGRALVLEAAGKTAHGSLLWRCRCDCGRVWSTRGHTLRSGATQSCGCLAIERARSASSLPPGEAGFRRLLGVYKISAKNRNLPFSLSEAHFRKLTQGFCRYCGIPPSRVSLALDFAVRVETRKKNEFLYNGIDRIDNAVGYIESNCVTCCTECNRAKGTMSYSKFLEWVLRCASILGKEKNRDIWRVLTYKV